LKDEVANFSKMKYFYNFVIRFGLENH